MRIGSNFDGGNIDVLGRDGADAARLAIRRDTQADFFQWFDFRVAGVRGRAITLAIENAGEASYPKGWEDYRAVASYDLQTWFRVPTGFDGRSLTISHTPDHDIVEYAYFAPYPLLRHRAFVGALQMRPGVRAGVVGATVDERDLDLIETGEGPLSLWFIGRQHPGETQASWWMEGFLDRLTDPDDALARRLRGLATFHVVPHMNPDGGVRGNLRTNAAGANLNREWQAPSEKLSPEVFHVRARMAATGVDFMLDVHGDEGLPYNFIAGPDGIAGYPAAMLERKDEFCAALRAANPDFQTEVGYPPAAPGAADMRICTKYVAGAFACLAMTLEQPFKDSAITPDPVAGWSPGRCRRLGAATLDALAAVVDRLR
jgi:murein tripeptide amidase MpaA